MSNPAPPPRGVRQVWSDIPAPVQATITAGLGSPVVAAASQPNGFSPGVAARVQLADGRRLFLKATSPTPNALSAEFHRRERRIAAALPSHAPAPRLLWSYDGGQDGDPDGWVVLVYAAIDGYHPQEPWRDDELTRVLDALAELAATLTPSPLPTGAARAAPDTFTTHLCGWQALRDGPAAGRAGLDPWSLRHLDALAKLEAQAPAAAQGDTLLHFDVRADNVLLTPDRVWFVDWPHATVGAPWLDGVLLAPSVAMQGGPPPAALLQRFAPARAADPHAIFAVVAGMAGFLTVAALQPPPPGLPTLRAFQDAQGVIARAWLAEGLGWR